MCIHIEHLLTLDVCFLQLITWSKKHLGPRLFRKVMRATVYGQFVAGENLKEVRPVMDELRKKGIRSILDYAVEDVTGSTNILAKCEQNKQNFIECIDVAGEVCGWYLWRLVPMAVEA